MEEKKVKNEEENSQLFIYGIKFTNINFYILGQSLLIVKISQRLVHENFQKF